MKKDFENNILCSLIPEAVDDAGIESKSNKKLVNRGHKIISLSSSIYKVKEDFENNILHSLIPEVVDDAGAESKSNKKLVNRGHKIIS